MEGARSCYRGGQFNRGRMVMLHVNGEVGWMDELCFSLCTVRENGYVWDMRWSLMEGE